MEDNFFKIGNTPSFLKIDWDEAIPSSSFSFSYDELGSNGQDVIRDNAKKEGVDVIFIKRATVIDFYVIDTSNSKKNLFSKAKLNKIFNIIKDSGSAGITQIPLSRLVNIRPVDLMTGIDILKKDGTIRSEVYKHKGRGGRPTKIYYACG